MSHEPPYDPYIPAGGQHAAPGGASNQQNGNQRTAQLQAVSILSPIAATDTSSDRMICDDYISGSLVGWRRIAIINHWGCFEGRFRGNRTDGFLANR